MNYERFSQLWDALVTSRPKIAEVEPITNGISAETASALIEYGEGNKSKVESIRAFLRSPQPVKS